MKHALSALNRPADIETRTGGDHDKTVIAIAMREVARAYKRQTKLAVYAQLKKEIEDSLNEASSTDAKDLKARLKDLEIWLQSDHGFRFDGAGADAGLALLHALSDDRRRPRTALPQAEQKDMSRLDLAKALLSVSQPNGASTRTRPGIVWPRGLFVSVVRSAWDSMPQQLHLDKADAYNMAADQLDQELRLAGVQFVPGPHARSTTPDAHFWTTLNATALRQGRPSTTRMSESQLNQLRLEEGMKNAVAASPTSEWSVAECGAESFLRMLEKEVPPQEFFSYPASFTEDARVLDENEYALWSIDDFTTYFRRKYDPSNDIHRMAGIIGCAYMLQFPKVEHDKGLLSRRPETGSAFSDFIYASPWLPNAKSPTSHASHFVFLVASYFIALYDENMVPGRDILAADRGGPAFSMPKHFREKWGTHRLPTTDAISLMHFGRSQVPRTYARTPLLTWVL